MLSALGILSKWTTGPAVGWLTGPPQHTPAIVSASNPAASSSVKPAAAAPTTTTLTATDPTNDNTPVYGEQVTLTASVTSGTATVSGQVEFFDNGSSLGTAWLRGGQATLKVSNLSVATTANPIHTITAEYLGNANFAATATPLPSVTETVSAANTFTLLTTWKNPAASGDSVTLVARVSPDLGSAATTGGSPWRGGWEDGGWFDSEPSAPSGQVTFQTVDANGNVVSILGTAQVIHGVAVLTTAAGALADGTYTITAVYQGDGNYNQSTSQAVSQTVGSSLQGARIDATASRPAVVGTPVTFSVAVSPKGSGTGATSTGDTVSFVDATVSTSNQLTNSPVSLDSSGKATFTATFTTPGLHVIVATYTPVSGSSLAGSQTFIPVYVFSTAPTTGSGSGGGFGNPNDYAILDLLAGGNMT